MINNEFEVLKNHTTFLYSTEWDFSNLYTLCSRLFDSEEVNLQKYEELFDRSGTVLMNFNLTNKWEMVELTDNSYYKLMMNSFSGCDYLYYIREFRSIREFNMIPFQLHDLIEHAGRYGNELGIEIIADMDNETLILLHKKLKEKSEKLQDWLSNFTREITTEVYLFIKLSQLFNELPHERIQSLQSNN